MSFFLQTTMHNLIFQFILKFEAFKIPLLKPIILNKNKLIEANEINTNQVYVMVSILNNLAV